MIQEDTLYIERTLAGDTTAFAVLVERHQDLVFSVVVKIVRQRQDAEDVAQEVFLKAFRSLSSFRKDARFSTWLCRIAYNAAVSYVRKKRPDKISDTVEVSDGLLMEHESADSADYLEYQLRLLKVSMSKLSTDDEVLITLYYRHGKTTEEIATITSISVSNVKVRLHRIRKKLYEHMKEVQE